MILLKVYKIKLLWEGLYVRYSKLITECYELWLYCENGGISYIDTNGSITKNYKIEYDGENCNVVYVYTDTSHPPTSTAFRIIKK